MEQIEQKINVAQQKIDQVLDQLQRISSMDNDLWGIKEIGKYLKYSNTKVHTVVHTNGFPRPVRLPTVGAGAHPRWYSNEVKAWVRKWKQ